MFFFVLCCWSERTKDFSGLLQTNLYIAEVMRRLINSQLDDIRGISSRQNSNAWHSSNLLNLLQIHSAVRFPPSNHRRAPVPYHSSPHRRPSSTSVTLLTSVSIHLSLFVILPPLSNPTSRTTPTGPRCTRTGYSTLVSSSLISFLSSFPNQALSSTCLSTSSPSQPSGRVITLLLRPRVILQLLTW